MKKIDVDEKIFPYILNAYFNFLKLWAKGKALKVEFYYDLKGVGQNCFTKRRIAANFNCFNTKISDEICVEIKPKKASKGLLITIENKKAPFWLFEGMENKMPYWLFAPYFNNLAQELLGAFLPVSSFGFNKDEAFFYPNIKFANLPTKKHKVSSHLADDILTILYSFYCKRNLLACFIKVNLDDILAYRNLKGSNKKQARKRVLAAFNFLADIGLIQFKKMPKNNFKIIVNENRFFGGFFVDEVLLTLNPKTMFLEKIIGNTLCKLAHKGCFEIGVIDLINLVLRHLKCKKPYFIRNRIEAAFEKLFDCGFLKCWEYKNYNEDIFYLKDWFKFYKKFSIIFWLERQNGH